MGKPSFTGMGVSEPYNHTIGVSQVSHLRADVAEREALVHGLLRVLVVCGGREVPAVVPRAHKVVQPVPQVRRDPRVLLEPVPSLRVACGSVLAHHLEHPLRVARAARGPSQRPLSLAEESTAATRYALRPPIGCPSSAVHAAELSTHYAHPADTQRTHLALTPNP